MAGLQASFAELDALEESFTSLKDERAVASPTPAEEPPPPAERSHTPPPNAASKLISKAKAPAEPKGSPPNTAKGSPPAAEKRLPVVPKKADTPALSPSPSGSMGKVSGQCWINPKQVPKGNKMPRTGSASSAYKPPVPKLAATSKTAAPSLTPRPPSVPPPTTLVMPWKTPPWKKTAPWKAKDEAPEPPATVAPQHEARSSGWRQDDSWWQQDNRGWHQNDNQGWQQDNQDDRGWQQDNRGWQQDNQASQTKKKGPPRDDATKQALAATRGNNSTRFDGPSGGRRKHWQTAIKKVQNLNSPAQLKAFLERWPRPDTKEQDEDFARRYYGDEQ